MKMLQLQPDAAQALSALDFSAILSLESECFHFHRLTERITTRLSKLSDDIVPGQAGMHQTTLQGAKLSFFRRALGFQVCTTVSPSQC